MKKIKFFLAAMASVALVSCMNDEFVGNSPGTTAEEDTPAAISFGSGYQAVTRANGSTAANLLGKEMKIYGVKRDRTIATKYNTVFENYSVKYDDTKTGYDEYNNGWYYVGAESGQTIRYWDQASADYHFVAGSPVASFTYATDGTTGDITTATITGLGGRLNHSETVTSTASAVYIADPIVVAKANYNNEVEFSFSSMQSKVRVGIYETIPGYKISSITFYNNATTPVGSDYITLNCETDDYFQGGSASVGGTITYNWTTTPATYTFAYSGTGLTKTKYWEGGQFAEGVTAVSSTGAVADLYGTETNKDANGYFIVMPTAVATAAPLTLTCDYTLTALQGTVKETIEVKGATATIPAAYTKWAPNTAYTYLFKITDNTNGTTGGDGDPAGLYPITFDAVTVDFTDQQIGTETTVSTPSITCYQNGNVSGNGIQFVSGADITVTTTVAANITVKELSGAFDYGKDYDQQTYNNTTFGTEGTLSLGTGVTSATFGSANITNNKTYVIKAVNGANTAYFVLVVGAAEVGPNN